MGLIGIKGGLVLAAVAMLQGGIAGAWAQSAPTGQSAQDPLPAPVEAQTPAAPLTPAEVKANTAWTDAMDATPAPDTGCFQATYPNPDWVAVPCHAPLNKPFGRPGRLQADVGHGSGSMAQTTQLTRVAYGELPVVQGVKSIKGPGGAANIYSLQVNSNFMTTGACKGSANANCRTWEQFVYASGEGLLFMQYWLVSYGPVCPAKHNWISYQGSCYKSSTSVTVPKIPATQLQGLKLKATAVANWKDKITFYMPKHMYTMTGDDHIVDLATQWTATEFNVFGDGAQSPAANFNKGSKVTVLIALFDGTTATPACIDGGTTAETNNLNISSCRPFGGAPLMVKIKENN